MSAERPAGAGQAGQVAESLAVPSDEPAGDMGDQASRLQMAQEQEAIAAALAGRVEGTDALEGRGALAEPLEGGDAIDDADDSSDDPVHGGGSPGGAPTAADLFEDADAVAVDEGSSVEDELPLLLEQDGDPDVVDGEVPLPVGAGAEDLDDLQSLGVLEPLHDPDDPSDPDGYGVPPGSP